MDGATLYFQIVLMLHIANRKLLKRTTGHFSSFNVQKPFPLRKQKITYKRIFVSNLKLEHEGPFVYSAPTTSNEL